MFMIMKECKSVCYDVVNEYLEGWGDGMGMGKIVKSRVG